MGAAAGGGGGGAGGRPTGRVIGIDLGTTYSVAGVWRDGKVDIIPNELGNRITPSVVGFLPDGERLIGDGARNQMAGNPANTISAVKRFMGRQFSERTVQSDKQLLGYKVVSGSGGRAAVRVSVGNDTRTMSPEEVSAMVLGKMRIIAEDYLGEPVHDAVVTVPAYFSDAQRKATKDAGAIAGLNVRRIINEPTAAALAYGLDAKSEQNILVFDLGGGTFDVSVLQIDDGFFEVLATNGDTHLGGEDFDNRMVKHLLKIAQKRHGVDLSGRKGAVARLRQAAESAKRRLSSQPDARIEVDGLSEGVDFSETVTRAKFEELSMDLFKGCLKPVESVLKDAGLKKSDIDHVVLVGGSTRIPKVRELLRQYFNGKKLNEEINPDEAVAYGAAVQGGILRGDSGDGEKGPRAIVVDVAPLSLGIETVGGIMTKIVDRNTPVPADRTQTFSTTKDQQETVSIRVFEGERSLTKDNHLLGQFDLSGIPPAPRGVAQIEVKFDLDQNNILTVTARDKSSDSEKSMTITSSAQRMTEDEILQKVAEAERYAEEDKIAKERAEARLELDQLAVSLQRHVRDDEGLGGKLSEEDKESLSTAASDALRWLDENPSADADDLRSQIRDLKEISDPIVSSFYGGSGGGDDDDAEPTDEL
eukprot:TRINITY_DN43299_c0_g1_i1.p1 TRINITY_DN43299_c0_g1~~TRINITY_DN43299_c0_g1_i1.p1  ORF type:complete len:714 (+),score=249.59 TRINITY_DN43299_c0_g1_i1:207-2144(+)